MHFPLSYVIAAIGSCSSARERGFPCGANTAWRASLTPPRRPKPAPVFRPTADEARTGPLPEARNSFKPVRN